MPLPIDAQRASALAYIEERRPHSAGGLPEPEILAGMDHAQLLYFAWRVAPATSLIESDWAQFRTEYVATLAPLLLGDAIDWLSAHECEVLGTDAPREVFDKVWRAAAHHSEMEERAIRARDAEPAPPEPEEEEPKEEEPAGYTPDGSPLTQEEIENDYVYSNAQDGYIPSDSAVTCADDPDCYMTERYRERHCYISDADGQYYRREENMPEYGDDDREEDSEEEADLFSYSTDVLDVCDADWQPDALVFGAELEMEPQTEDYSGQCDIVSVLGGKRGDGFILKSDGSLEHGVELVTVPMSLADHRKYWANILTRRLARVAQSGSGTERCGMHVHINRGALSPLTLGKMLVLCNSENPQMVRLLETVAQRRMNSWCQRSAKKITDGRGSRGDHYEILSLSGKGTAELRMFRGNLKPERVIKNLEFAHALVTYARECSIQDALDAETFAHWLVKHRHHYPVLLAYMAQTGLVALPVKKPAPLTLDGGPAAPGSNTNEDI